MADQDLTVLTAVVTPAGTDLLYTVQGGVDKKISVTQINSLVGGADPSLLGDGSNSAPSYSFTSNTGDGLYLQQAGVMSLVLGGSATERWKITGTQFGGAISGSPRILNAVTSSTIPNIIIANSDTNTGLGWVSADKANLIAGNAPCLQWAETGSQVPQLGFFGTNAVSKPTGVAVTDAGIHAALVTLGLIAA